MKSSAPFFSVVQPRSHMVSIVWPLSWRRSGTGVLGRREPSWRDRRLERPRRILQYRRHLLACDAGKPGQEIIRRCPIAEVVEERRGGDAGPTEQPGATHHLGVPLNSRKVLPVDHRCCSSLARAW